MPVRAAAWRLPRAWLAELAVALGLLSLAMVAVGPGLLPGRTPLPLDVLGLFEPWRLEQPTAANPEVGDSVLQFSSRVFLARALKSGHLPLWNPTVMAGQPFAGDTHSSPFYPPLLALSLLLSPLAAYAAQLLLQMWVGGLLMYLWLRALAPGRLPAVLAAITWMLAGSSQLWLAFPPFPGTLVWLPGIPAAWERARGGGRPGMVALGALATALAITAGQLQFFLYGLGILILYGLGRLAMAPRVERRRGAAVGAGILGLGLALGAVHLLPAYALARDTIRPPFTLDALLETGVPLRQLVMALAPWAFGDPRSGGYHGVQNSTEIVLYVGLAPLLLALGAMAVRRDRLAALFTLLALLVAGLALATPLAWPLAWLPWLQRFGLMRWLALWPLLAAPLAALALAAARDDAAAARRLRRALLVLAPGLALLALAAVGQMGWRDLLPALGLLAASAAALLLWSRRPGSVWRGAALLAVVTADLLSMGHGYAPDAPAAAYFPAKPPLDRLLTERARAPFRIAAFQGDVIALGPSVAPSLGLDEIGGYTSSVRESYRRFLAPLSTPTGNGALAANPNMVTLGDASPLLLRLLNVRYILSGSPLPPFERPLDVSAACRAPRTLGPGEVLAATVVPWADGLNRVDVAVTAGGPVAVHLRAAPDDARHLAYAELPPGDGPLRSMYFEPLADSAGRPLYLSVDRPAGAVGPPPTVCAEGDTLAVGLAATESPYPLAFEANGLGVYRAPPPLGQAWGVGRAVEASDQEDAVARLARGEVDPAREVIVERDQLAWAGLVDWLQNPGGGPISGPAATGLAVQADGPNVRRIALPAPAGGWLLLSEAWAPGWWAVVKGIPIPVPALRAYGGLIAVPLGRSSDEVVLRYLPLPVLAGALVTLVAALGVLASLVRGWRLGAAQHPPDGHEAGGQPRSGP